MEPQRDPQAHTERTELGTELNPRPLQSRLLAGAHRDPQKGACCRGCGAALGGWEAPSGAACVHLRTGRRPRSPVRGAPGTGCAAGNRERQGASAASFRPTSDRPFIARGDRTGAQLQDRGLQSRRGLLWKVTRSCGRCGWPQLWGPGCQARKPLPSPALLGARGSRLGTSRRDLPHSSQAGGSPRHAGGLPRGPGFRAEKVRGGGERRPSWRHVGAAGAQGAPALSRGRGV